MAAASASAAIKLNTVKLSPSSSSGQLFGTQKLNLPMQQFANSTHLSRSNVSTLPLATERVIAFRAAWLLIVVYWFQ